MPCVCLSNTFSRWQTIKALKLAERQQKPIPVKPDLSVKERGIFSDSKTLKIQHKRPAMRASGSAPTISRRPSVRMTRSDLINAESKLGSTIFGPIPEGHRREFFHDQKNIWIWHEDWYDGQRNPRQMTVRYEVRTSGIYKKISTGKYFKLEGEELENFRKATHAYLYVIKKNLYNRNPNAPKFAKLAR